jgi:alpha-glucosidase
VWRDGAPGGGPPNDWKSEFAAVGDAWTFDDRTGQWYLHSFMAEQPDLNWDNPEVEAAMHDTLRFWLDRGVDGFRIDALQRLAHDPLLRPNAGAARRHDQDWETMHDRLRGIRRVVEEYEGRMIVGEVALQDLHRVVSFLNSGDQLHLAHNFVFAELGWDAEAFSVSIDDFEALATDVAWPAWFLENHDLPRIASRFDEPAGLGAARARAALLMLYALRGTPFVYQGQELGLPDAEIPPERVVDVDGRDPERAPLPWRPPSAAGPGAGFTTGEPWLPLVADAEALNAETQAADPRSTLALARRLGALRRETPALRHGSQRTLDLGAGVLAWVREDGDERLLCAVNFAPEAVAIDAPGRVVLSSDPDRGGADGRELRAAEAVIVAA